MLIVSLKEALSVSFLENVWSSKKESSDYHKSVKISFLIESFFSLVNSY